MSVPFNPAQLATYEQARQLRIYLNANNIGRGIFPGDDEAGSAVISIPNPNFPWLPPTMALPGVYLPPWEPGPHADEIPHIGDAKWLHYRFRNGFKDVNVGLVIDKFVRYPGNPVYVLNEISHEVGY